MSGTNKAAKPLRVVVLISGSGSNLQALIDAKNKGELPIEIAAVISNCPDVQGLARAAKAGIPTLVLDHKTYASREAFDRALMAAIDAYTPGLVVLAGFMRILTAGFTEHYLGRMLNIHPSLLPKFQGLHTHQRAIDAGETRHGVTVHFVTAELDGGPACVQASVPILPTDDAGLLAKRVQRQEHVIYPLAVKWFAEGKLSMEQGKAWLNGELLPASGFQIESQEP
ncbi:phosphoribosylglycinamide formyltransferase [Cellvibrio japonicus]|uniref:Phosphoribosylglycinamide formyltransferase n=1 Tax=Cellvibrio japonicus (strain Ueda107) TaxID=498211 RepID=B3PEQ5_CELJU|nr:phosphoribosylglycinamide formyltransferase [Cellvibrio japonicus]ACE86321.1 phosphoribosylglycinamide formyltransferase [Cellvibrio japonicus Ueda107]QEI12160.1 phosphoribosylglycinamide formyltransferase [Cellvibrio japonicus]QEI15734.1 phosphoribosylglycinamide formyltransferase [Cellvibrio japonicus]QEI19312.1 phosphoribosylglycinamide formyltransferase [Cellvibrio japonicus]